ncbi:hypothetical protein ACFSJW_04025 [Flavobacterium artemisiae]|uniref:Carboxypeptidase regulatory-like domain-containing protein n=1 Tax=Flavobacterium artemisiae TaxID=2126556 RepID=A0ABW4HKC8_9FLAO
MKKTLLLLLTLFTIYSCDIQYDGETRIVVQGQVVDKDNNPIADKRIEINTHSSSDYVGSDLISFTNTDSEGKFTLIFPSPKSDEIDIVTTINGSYEIDYQNIQTPTSGYQSKSIRATKRNFANYKLDFNKIVLYKSEEITELEVALNQTSNNKQITDIHIEGNSAENFIDLKKEDENKNQYLKTLFDVAKNQNLKLSYSIRDFSNPANVVISQHEAIVTINSEKVIHTITY